MCFATCAAFWRPLRDRVGQPPSSTSGPGSRSCPGRVRTEVPRRQQACTALARVRAYSESTLICDCARKKFEKRRKKKGGAKRGHAKRNDGRTNSKKKTLNMTATSNAASRCPWWAALSSHLPARFTSRSTPRPARCSSPSLKHASTWPRSAAALHHRTHASRASSSSRAEVAFRPPPEPPPPLLLGPAAGSNSTESAYILRSTKQQKTGHSNFHGAQTSN